MIGSTSHTTPVDEFRHKTIERPQLAPFVPRSAISAGMATWSLVLGIALVCPAFLFTSLFPISENSRQEIIRSTLHLGFVILMSTITWPLMEEVIYRGLLLQLARRYLPVPMAIVLSSAVFAATHFMKGPPIILISFLMGCLFAWMAVRTGSLYPGILCHVIFDFTAVVFGRAFDINHKFLMHPSESGFHHPLTGLFPVWWIMLSIVMAATSFIMLARDFARDGRAVNAEAKLPLTAA